MISKDDPGCREIRWEIVEGMKVWGDEDLGY